MPVVIVVAKNLGPQEGEALQGLFRRDLCPGGEVFSPEVLDAAADALKRAADAAKQYGSPVGVTVRSWKQIEADGLGSDLGRDGSAIRIVIPKQPGDETKLAEWCRQSEGEISLSTP